MSCSLTQNSSIPNHDCFETCDDSDSQKTVIVNLSTQSMNKEDKDSNKDAKILKSLLIHNIDSDIFEFLTTDYNFKEMKKRKKLLLFKID